MIGRYCLSFLQPFLSLSLCHSQTHTNSLSIFSVIIFSLALSFSLSFFLSSFFILNPFLALFHVFTLFSILNDHFFVFILPTSSSLFSFFLLPLLLSHSLSLYLKLY